MQSRYGKFLIFMSILRSAEEKIDDDDFSVRRIHILACSCEEV